MFGRTCSGQEAETPGNPSGNPSIEARHDLLSERSAQRVTGCRIAQNIWGSYASIPVFASWALRAPHSQLDNHLPVRCFRVRLSQASCLFVCLSVCLFVCLFICLFICLSVCLSVCLFVCLFYQICTNLRHSWQLRPSWLSDCHAASLDSAPRRFFLLGTAGKLPTDHRNGSVGFWGHPLFWWF